MFDGCFTELAAKAKVPKKELDKLQRKYEALVLKEMKTGDKTSGEALQAALVRLEEEAGAAKALAQFRADQNTVKKASLLFDVNEVAGRIGGNKLEAIDRILMWHPDNKTGLRSVDKHAEAIYQTHSTELRKIADALGSRALGIMQRGDKVEIFTKHLYGEQIDGAAYPDVKPEEIKALKDAADSWADMTERGRVRSNKAGASIGKMESWAWPQKWDQYLVAKVTKKLNPEKPADAYVAIMKPLLSREKMVDDFDMPLDDADLEALLREAYLTITTDGASKAKEGPVRGGSIANRGSQERVLHFSSAENMLKAQGMFGSEQLLSILDGHMRSMSSQIAMLERGGPSFVSNIESIVEEIKVERARTGADTAKDAKRIRMIESEVRVLAGTATVVENIKRARFFQGVRNLQTMRLAGATIASLAGDPAQYRMQMILHAWDTNLPLQRRLGHVLNQQLQGSLDLTKSMLSSGYTDAVANMGLAAEAMNTVLYRHGEDFATSGWTSVMPAMTMRFSGLGYITNARREAMRVMTMGAVADKLKYSFDQLGDIDTKLIKGAGITKTDWSVYQAATPDMTLGKAVLTPDAVMKAPGFTEKQRLTAAENLTAFMMAEDKLNVLEPGMRQRAERIAGLHKGQVLRGQIKDELALNFMQFKAFPHAFMSSYFKRMQMFDGPMGKAAYMGGLITMSTIGGAMVNQIWNLLSGRDVESMDPAENPFFFGRALLRGGGLGFYGDFLQTDVNWQGQAGLQSMLGPATGQAALMMGTTAMGVRDVAAAGFEQASGNDVFDEDEAEKKWSRQVDAHVRDVKGLLPTNLWYTRAMTDRLIFNQIGETLRPGYTERMQDRAKSMFGTEYFWNPSDVQEMRAPEVGGAIGG